MSNNYLDAILSLEPDYEVSVIGDPSVYENINWGSETPINQATLDSVIASATLNQAKNKKKSEMRTARNEALSRFVNYSGHDHEMTAPVLAYLSAAVAHVAGGGSLPASFAVLTVAGGSGRPGARQLSRCAGAARRSAGRAAAASRSAWPA